MPGLTPRLLQRIGRAVRKVERDSPERSRDAQSGTPAGHGRRYVKLTSNLDPAGAGAPLTDAATASAKLLVPDGNGSDPEDLEESTDEITVVNRSKDLSGASGDFCVVVSMGFEWAVIAKDC